MQGSEDNFFNRSGTLRDLVGFSRVYQNSGQDAKSRFGALSGIVKIVMSLLA